MCTVNNMGTKLSPSEDHVRNNYCAKNQSFSIILEPNFFDKVLLLCNIITTTYALSPGSFCNICVKSLPITILPLDYLMCS